MKIESAEALATLCDTMKLKGVRAFEVDGIRIEFAPSVEVQPIDRSEVKTDPEMCLCGHAGYQHQNGLCILGCDMDRCVSPEDKEIVS